MLPLPGNLAKMGSLGRSRKRSRMSLPRIYRGPLEVIHEEDTQDDDEMRTRSESSLMQPLGGRSGRHGGRKRRRDAPHYRSESPGGGGQGRGKHNKGARGLGERDERLSHPLRTACPKHGSVIKTLRHGQDRIATDKALEQPKLPHSKRRNERCSEIKRSHDSRGRRDHQVHDQQGSDKSRHRRSNEHQKNDKTHSADRSPVKQALGIGRDTRSAQKMNNRECTPLKPTRSPNKGRERGRKHRRDRRYDKKMLLDDLFQIDNRLLEKLAKCEGTGMSPERCSSPRKSPRKTKKHSNMCHTRKYEVSTTEVTKVQNAIMELQDECKACLKHLSSTFGSDAIQTSSPKKGLQAISEHSPNRWSLKFFSGGKTDNNKITNCHNVGKNTQGLISDQVNNNNKSHISLNVILKKKDRPVQNIVKVEEEIKKESRNGMVEENNRSNAEKITVQRVDRQDTPRHHTFTRTAHSDAIIVADIVYSSFRHRLRKRPSLRRLFPSEYMAQENQSMTNGAVLEAEMKITEISDVHESIPEDPLEQVVEPSPEEDAQPQEEAKPKKKTFWTSVLTAINKQFRGLKRRQTLEEVS